MSFSGEAGDPTLDINARVIPPATPLSVSFSAEAGDPTLTIDARAISADPPIAAAFGMEAGDATLSISARAIAPVITLLLSDFDDTGLEVDAAALLVASAPGTTGNNPYADSDRGGADSPLDGELGLSSTQTVISRIRRHSATELNLNDNDNPAILDIGAYFDAGGDGNDLTLYLQTNDGLVSFPIAGQLTSFGGNFARFTLPAAAQTLLDNLDTGDRWIFAFAKTASIAPVNASFEGSAGILLSKLTPELLRPFLHYLRPLVVQPGMLP